MKQQVIEIRSEDLLERTARFKKEGCRLVQILCTRVEEGYELTYTFDKSYFLYHLRLIVPLTGSVMSVTSLYWYGFVWEMKSTTFSAWTSASSCRKWTTAAISTIWPRRPPGTTCPAPSMPNGR